MNKIAAIMSVDNSRCIRCDNGLCANSPDDAQNDKHNGSSRQTWLEHKRRKLNGKRPKVTERIAFSQASSTKHSPISNFKQTQNIAKKHTHIYWIHAFFHHSRRLNMHTTDEKNIRVSSRRHHELLFFLIGGVGFECSAMRTTPLINNSRKRKRGDKWWTNMAKKCNPIITHICHVMTPKTGTSHIVDRFDSAAAFPFRRTFYAIVSAHLICWGKIMPPLKRRARHFSEPKSFCHSVIPLLLFSFVYFHKWKRPDEKRPLNRIFITLQKRFLAIGILL